MIENDQRKEYLEAVEMIVAGARRFLEVVGSEGEATFQEEQARQSMPAFALHHAYHVWDSLLMRAWHPREATAAAAAAAAAAREQAAAGVPVMPLGSLLMGLCQAEASPAEEEEEEEKEKPGEGR